jgi:hypothetical protein
MLVHDDGKAAMQALEYPASAWRPFFVSGADTWIS